MEGFKRKAKKKSIKSLLPCKSCPWRVENDASIIPNYRHEKACNLVNTVGEGDGMRKIMACHHSTDRVMHACKGYLAREGFNNISVRFLHVLGQIENPYEIADACQHANVRLHANYPEVLRKLEESAA